MNLFSNFKDYILNSIQKMRRKISYTKISLHRSITEKYRWNDNIAAWSLKLWIRELSVAEIKKYQEGSEVLFSARQSGFAFSTPIQSVSGVCPAFSPTGDSSPDDMAARLWRWQPNSIAEVRNDLSLSTVPYMRFHRLELSTFLITILDTCCYDCIIYSWTTFWFLPTTSL